MVLLSNGHFSGEFQREVKRVEFMGGNISMFKKTDYEDLICCYSVKDKYYGIVWLCYLENSESFTGSFFSLSTYEKRYISTFITAYLSDNYPNHEKAICEKIKKTML